jgi:hypothetical protein
MVVIAVLSVLLGQRGMTTKTILSCNVIVTNYGFWG